MVKYLTSELELLNADYKAVGMVFLDNWFLEMVVLNDLIQLDPFALVEINFLHVKHLNLLHSSF